MATTTQILEHTNTPHGGKLIIVNLKEQNVKH